MEARTPYPGDVSDEEWALVAPYLTALRAAYSRGGHCYMRSVLTMRATCLTCGRS